MLPPFTPALATWAAFAFFLVNGKPCPPLGPVLPTTQQPSRDATVADAVKALKDRFALITAGFEGSAVSIGVQSIHENNPLVDLHFTPDKKLQRGSQTVTANSVYRIGSATKLFTVLAVLQQENINLEDPVTKYLPSLLANQPRGSDIEAVKWNEVTVGALASHVAGIGRDMAFDIAIFPGPWDDMGLPPVKSNSGPRCSGLGGTKTCNAGDLLSQFTKRHPQYAPFSAPFYSNVGTSLLGLVVEAASNKTLDQLMHENILGPLGMSNTTLIQGPSSDQWAFIPVNESTWGLSLGVSDSAGGMYSNTADMLKFGTALLKYDLLGEAKTRKWLKPHVFTSSAGQFLGAPWEIERSDRLTSDGRLVEIYTKAGDLGLYHSMFALVPDYDLVISVMTAGPEASAAFFFSANIVSQVLKAIVPAVDQASRNVAKANFVGTYSDSSTNSTVVLDMDGGPGLVLANWTIRGFDVLANFPKYSVTPSSKAIPGLARLYPSGLQAANQTGWRMVFDQVSESEGQKFDAEVVMQDGSCVNWGTMDRFNYDFVGLEEFVFNLSLDGVAASINPRAFDVMLRRVSN
ncbi:beta-lactamase [Lasiosphaeria miniovina]|uniref:Beta-lactamase n=1 Tax=Lasiosphaeria miniovina TaxID=1954250 RepID=A0AA40E9C7_9PEZI|nr:beta-lactamase [Lasiosphaeria miniovina]KAK0728886.1 beta-lactamase [Lasiosphaeria miniovina]